MDESHSNDNSRNRSNGTEEEKAEEREPQDSDADDDSHQDTNLPRAMKVNENPVLPIAEHCTPNNTPLCKNGRILLYTTAILVVAIVAAVAIVVGLVKTPEITTITRTGNHTDSEDKSTHAQPRIRFSELKTFLGNGNQLGDPKSLQYQAAEWIINEDPLNLTDFSERFAQRYVLALFYLKTSQDKRWRSL